MNKCNYCKEKIEELLYENNQISNLCNDCENIFCEDCLSDNDGLCPICTGNVSICSDEIYTKKDLYFMIKILESDLNNLKEILLNMKN